MDKKLFTLRFSFLIWVFLSHTLNQTKNLLLFVSRCFFKLSSFTIFFSIAKVSLEHVYRISLSLFKIFAKLKSLVVFVLKKKVDSSFMVFWFFDEFDKWGFFNIVKLLSFIFFLLFFDVYVIEFLLDFLTFSFIILYFYNGQ